METVQLQCGHCKNVMAISVEHLGGQVQCPHCKGVVQTQARSPEVAAPMPNMELQQRESIFGGPEASDFVIGETAAPRVELPPAPVRQEPASIEMASAPTEAEHDADLTRLKPRPVYEKGVFALIALIFLVPYGIVTTLIILYLLFVQPTRGHPFDMMVDPVPAKEKGGAKHVMRIIHDHKLAAHQKVTLGKSIQVGKDGDLLVTPEKVLLTEEGDLKLFLRAKNVSTNTAFEPTNDAWIKYTPRSDEPYTFLESKSKNITNIYGAYLEYRKSLTDKSDLPTGNAVLGPKEERIVVLTTQLEYQKAHIPSIAKSNDSFTWRVQLRRGFVKYRGKDVSATAVIGVEFTSAQIERAGKKS